MEESPLENMFSWSFEQHIRGDIGESSSHALVFWNDPLWEVKQN